MFGKLREKLKSWIKTAKEKIVEKEEVKEKVVKKKRAKKKVEKDVEKIEKLIEESKEKEIPETPLEFEVAKQKYEPDIEEIKKRVEEKKPSFFQKLKTKFVYKISEEAFDSIFEDLEILLLENNVALEVVESLKKKLKEKLVGKEISKNLLEEEIKKEFKSALEEIVTEPDDLLPIIKSKKPFVILFFGVNGSGKTTSIAKLAYLLKNNNISVVLAAADTFRAASIEQLTQHAKNLGVPLIKHEYGSDPAAVGYDAIKYAEKHEIGAVLIDTAGRMHTQTNLLKEMEKIARVTNPDLKIFVAESIAGNDVVEQVKTFHEHVGIDGFILTKADIDEKGGTALSISFITRKPIFYLGVGQKYEDIKAFNKKEYIKSLGF